MSPWVSGESLSPANLNRHAAEASTAVGFSSNTLTAESGLTIGLSSAASMRDLLVGHIVNAGGTPLSTGSAVQRIVANSSVSNYLYFEDSSAAKSNYVLGSNFGGTVDGLNIGDASANTMIVSFSKQSVRFFQPVVGPVFDTGGALSSTYNAALFLPGSSKESQIQAAITAAAADGIARVYVPASMYPYSAASISFSTRVQMVREGSNWAVYDTKAYGATANGIVDDTIAAQAAITAAQSAGNGTVYFSSGTYLTSNELLISNVIGVAFDGGAYIKLKSGSGAHSVLRVTAGATIDGANVIGNGEGGGSTISMNGIVLDGATEATIQNCAISGVRLFGLYVTNGATKNLLFNNLMQTAYSANSETDAADIVVSAGGHNDDNFIISNRCLSTNKNAGIMLRIVTTSDTVNRNTVFNNLVDGAIRNPSNTGGQGLQMYGLSSGSSVGLMDSNAFIGNVIRNTQNMGIYLNSGPTNPPITGHVISENRVLNCLTVGSGGAINDAAIAIDNAPLAIVTNNQVIGGGADGVCCAIALGAAANDVVVANNHCSSLSSFIGGFHVRNVANASRARVSGNYFIGNGNSSTIFISDGTAHTIEGNVCRNSGYRGIEIGTTARDTRVIGNLVDSPTNQGLSTLGGAARTVFAFNNVILGSGSFRIDAGTNTEWFGNHQNAGPMQGQAILVSGLTIVNTGEIVANDYVRLTVAAVGGTPGIITLGTITSGTSFAINSSSNADTSTVFWEIVH